MSEKSKQIGIDKPDVETYFEDNACGWHPKNDRIVDKKIESLSWSKNMMLHGINQ
ncbi:hypothetical protein [Microcoleus sp.]|uniref:hypothetical protein n=1 Tax=Microcoleus sp. TaxID=44472 RepID=UPI0035930947